MRVGHLVLALGRPGSAGLHATLGLASARLDTEREGKLGYILHTDALLYPGFSGGALVDLAGRLVGIVNLTFGRGKGVAIGTPVAAQVAEALLTHGQVRRAYLGVTTQPVAIPASRLGVTQEHALLLSHVASGSPAEAAGLLVGDLLLRLGDTPLEGPEALRRSLRSLQPGSEAVLAVLRGGEPLELRVTLGEA